MLQFSSYRVKSISLCIILLLGFSFFTQSQSAEDKYIENKLRRIDSLVLLKQYDRAVTLINNTQNTFSFKNDNERSLQFDFRYAKILYESGQENKALEKTLEGFGKLKSNETSALYIDYANLLAYIFAKSQNFDKAFYYNRRALKAALHIKDTFYIVKSYNRLGSFHYAKDVIDSAKFFYRKVIYFKDNPKSEKAVSTALNNLGVIAQFEDNYPLAKYYAQEAINVKKRGQDTLGITSMNINLANLYHNEKKYKIAIDKYLDAGKWIEKDGSLNALVIKRAIYDNLSLSHDSLGDYKMAYHYLLKFKDINRKINENIINKNLAETEAKYNLAREEQKTETERNRALRSNFLFYGLAFFTLTFIVLVLIFYKNYKLKQQNKLEQIQNDVQTSIINATIDAKEKERKTIAEILHDSVSALLSSANLHLQASKAQLNSKAPIEITKAQQIVGEASVKIRDLSHELISSVLLKFGLAFAVHDMCEKYSNSKFTLMSDANGIKRYSQKFEIKIYNIIEELTNNIIKHSKAKNASIMLTERDGNKLIIQIIDDGKGFDVKRARNKNGLGLSHIEARIKVMKGVFNINSKKGEGTSIFISAPIHVEELVEIE